MLRDIIKIDDEKCNGCGICVPNCHEGALQIIDGKARLVSELMCDGLGACIGHCPEDAITIEKREAAAYDEVLTIKEMIPKGQNTIIAHLKHLSDHNQTQYFREAIEYLHEVEADLPFSLAEVKAEVHGHNHSHSAQDEGASACGGGCPGSAPIDLAAVVSAPGEEANTADVPSALTHWPVQMHLINPVSEFFKGSDMLLAADCVAFTAGNFHQKFLKGKSLAIACPKLDSGKEMYVEKIRMLIDEAKINTLTVMLMEVPCCGGLLQLVQMAQAQASRKVPVKLMVVSIKGEIIKEEWV